MNVQLSLQWLKNDYKSFDMNINNPTPTYLWVKTHYEWTIFHHFSPKKWCRTSVIGMQYVEVLIFGNLKHKKKTLECALQHFKTQHSFWIKIKLDPMVSWKGLDKINVHKIYDVHFFNGHRASCLWFMTHYQTKKKWKNNTTSTYKISSFFLK